MNKQTQETLQFVKLSGAFCQKAIDEINQHRKQADAAEAKQAEMLDLLKSAGVIDEGQEKLAADMLGNHAASLDLLKNAIDQIVAMRKESVQKEAMAQGSAADDPYANTGQSANSSLDSPFVGLRTSEKKASDLALMQGLGVPQVN
jgi:hypothetical protein